MYMQGCFTLCTGVAYEPAEQQSLMLLYHITSGQMLPSVDIVSFIT